MARFFIDRPVFAWVISLLIVLAGVLAIRFLPVAQYPDIAPPVVNVSASYPGASAKVVEEAVTAIIEREMNGAPGLLYTKATSSTGQASLTLTFRQGVNADLAAVEVQNRLKIVESRLPESVRRDGIYVEKAADSIQLIVTLTSSSGRYDAMELGEIASSNVLQALRRVEGVGKVETWGAEYAMRIWPDPAKLTSMNLSASDLVNAVRRHNARLTVGDIGNLGVPDSAPISATVKVDDTLVTPEQFGEIPLRIRADGGAIRLRDVARVEFGQSEYGFVSRVNQMTATGLAVKMAPGSNAVATAKRIRATLDELSRYFPEGVSYNIPYDTSAFVEISIRKVVSTLLEAMLLVFAVMYLFMQNFRATLIPTLVVPVALLGTFTVMLGLGFSINVLTMFGMVLAIGILVDDAIIVVENVERLMAEEGLSPHDATVKAMRQISGAIVERINQRFAGLPNRTVYAMNSPPLPDLGSTSGFDFRLQDRGGVGYEALVKARDQLLARAAEDPRLANVMFAGQGEAPQIRLDIDRRKAETLGVSMDEINTTLAVMFGSDYIGDFMHGSQVRKVVVQADGAKRLGIDDIGRLHVRNEQGEMVPLATFAKAAWTLGPPQLTRYNGYPSFNLEGQAAPGYSSGEAMQAMEQLMQGLPEGIAHEWSGQSFEERLSGAQAPALFALSVLIVFLALAALYESWSIPLAVILVVPLGVLGALLGVSLRGLPNDIYFKVGLITIIGLSAKNAILIIEVAKDHYQEGMSLLQATLEAARLRLRPIVMTSLAFGFGVVPLALSSGAGSGAQVAIGTGVLGGIVTATVLAVFLVPLFFLVVGRLFRLRKAPRTGNSPQIPTEQA
ncbi:efflux RND transporter permease subunit [Pseudomonas aeruginosa]